MSSKKPRALISVSDKSGIQTFARGLIAAGYEIVSSGGTYSHLKEAGLDVIKVSEVTGFPEILDGRVKTLHPNIHGALLARYELASHREQLDQHGIHPIRVVVVNLYPFAETIAKPGVTVPDAIEQIDIGGPAMIRATAKNFQNVTIITDPDDYETFLAEIGNGAEQPTLDFRLSMAQKAFQHTFAYDMKISGYLDQVVVRDGKLTHHDSGLPPHNLRLFAQMSEELRYGENPHQHAAFYSVPGTHLSDNIHKHQGKSLSYNNLVDMDAAWRCVCDFEGPTAVIVKHTNPCGVAGGDNLEQAFRRARQVDETSAFGGVIALNRCVDAATAKAINENFAEIVVAPEFSEEALKQFRKKKNMRILEVKHSEAPDAFPYEVKRLSHGWLVQEPDNKRVPFEDWKLVSKRQPSASEIEALKTAWTIVAHVKSNAIVYAKADGAVGIGAGQMSRVDSARIGISKANDAGLTIDGSAMASDAFFPFRDSVDAAAKAGVTAIVEPGGSIRDDEVIAAADEHNIVLFFTDTRHFKH